HAFDQFTCRRTIMQTLFIKKNNSLYFFFVFVITAIGIIMSAFRRLAEQKKKKLNILCPNRCKKRKKSIQGTFRFLTTDKIFSHKKCSLSSKVYLEIQYLQYS